MRKNVGAQAPSGIMHKMNGYIERRNRQLEKNPVHSKYRDMSVEELIRAYKSPLTPKDERDFCLESIYLKVFFFFPYFLGKKNYRLSPTLYDETLQNISQSILDAVARFDPDRGKLFLSYAYGDIMSAVTKTFKDLNVIQMPSSCREKSYLKEDPSDPDEADDSSDQDTVGVDEYLEKPEYGLLASDEPNDSCRDICADRVLSSKGSQFVETEMPTVVDYEDALHSEELVGWLEKALSEDTGVLTEDERMVLVLHNGLFGNRPHVYTDIAKMRSKMGKGSSRSRISQIHTKAVKKVRDWFERTGVREDG